MLHVAASTIREDHMTRTIAILLVILLITAVATAQGKRIEGSKTSNGKTETAVINVPTIVCNSCVNNVTKAVKKVSGVKTAKVDLEKKTATISYVSTKTTLSKLEKAIANAGYNANNTKRNKAAYDKLDACCKQDAKE